MIHTISVTPGLFEKIASGAKSFVTTDASEYDDKVEIGDYIAVNEYDADSGEYTNRSMVFCVDYIEDSDMLQTGSRLASIKPCYVHKKGAPYNPATMDIDYCVPIIDGGEVREKEAKCSSLLGRGRTTRCQD